MGRGHARPGRPRPGGAGRAPVPAAADGRPDGSRARALWRRPDRALRGLGPLPADRRRRALERGVLRLPRGRRAVTVAFQQRKRWRNHTGNQTIEPLRIYRPATLEDVREIVRTAERDGATVRAVGSGHSWSDVALTTGYLLRPDRLNRPLEITGNLVRVEAGMRLRELNRHLADN